MPVCYLLHIKIKQLHTSIFLVISFKLFDFSLAALNQSTVSYIPIPAGVLRTRRCLWWNDVDKTSGQCKPLITIQQITKVTLSEAISYLFNFIDILSGIAS